MDHDDACAQLVELGARIVQARLLQYEAQTNLVEAQRELVGLSSLVAPMLTADDQYACWLESVALVGVGPEHPALAHELEAFRRRLMSDTERRLNAQINNAEWN